MLRIFVIYGSCSKIRIIYRSARCVACGNGGFWAVFAQTEQHLNGAEGCLILFLNFFYRLFIPFIGIVW